MFCVGLRLCGCLLVSVLTAADCQEGSTSEDVVSLMQLSSVRVHEREKSDSLADMWAGPALMLEQMSARELWEEKRPTYTDFMMFLTDRLYNETEAPTQEEAGEGSAEVEDEHPNLMYNWGVKWDQWYDDMMHLFPPNEAKSALAKGHGKTYSTLNYGYVSDKLHECVKDVPAGEYLQTPFNQTAGSNMYAELASKSPVSLKEAKVLEISSGRGGGSALVSDCFCPAEMVGLDFSKRQAKSAQESYGREGKCPLKFMHGDAMNLPFEDNSFDVIMNVEASHAYPSYRTFASEAHRVLRPGGVLLTTDFRKVDDSETDARILKDVFRKDEVKPIDVSNQVLKALGENQLIGPFVAKCFETLKAKLIEHEESNAGEWDLHRDGMGTKNPLGCAEMSGQFMQFSLGTGVFNYRMYILKKDEM